MKNISHRVLLLALFLASFTFISSTSTQQQEAKHDPIAINMETKLTKRNPQLRIAEANAILTGPNTLQIMCENMEDTSPLHSF